MFIFHTTALSEYKTICLVIIKNIHQVSRFRNSRMFLLEERIIIFKTLAISPKFLAVIPNSLTKELKKNKETLTWHSSPSKISHKTLCSKSENSELKHADISSKIIKLTRFLALKTLWWKVSWIENNSFSPYKQIL